MSKHFFSLRAKRDDAHARSLLAEQAEGEAVARSLTKSAVMVATANGDPSAVSVASHIACCGGLLMAGWWAAIDQIDATLLTVTPLMAMSGAERAFRVTLCQHSVWGGRSIFSEADIQIEGLQWSGTYFGNASGSGRSFSPLE